MNILRRFLFILCAAQKFFALIVDDGAEEVGFAVLGGFFGAGMAVVEFEFVCAIIVWEKW